MTDCLYFPSCTGCTLWNVPYKQQKDRKISHLEHLLKAHNLKYEHPIDFLTLGDKELRHRADFTIEFDEKSQTHKFGFYDKHKQLIHIEKCIQLSPELQKVYTEFTRLNFNYNNVPIKKGSVRLRVSPAGLKGCWLDFANIDIKHLLEDKTLLNQLLDLNFIVEIGQKGKKLVRNSDVLKLSDPESQVWFETLGDNNERLFLKCLISDFTQPSWVSAKAIVNETIGWINQHDHIQSILEFGPGIGQFTLSFLSLGLNVEACEINSSSLTQLKNNAYDLKLDKNLALYLGDFHKKVQIFKNQHDLIFVNPARSGLKKFTDVILNSDAKYIIYVSCFPESMIQDISRLVSMYKLRNIIIIDQFPQTEHFESFVVLEKLN